MIVREYLMTRKDGVKLYKTYSDKNKYIRKVGRRTDGRRNPEQDYADG